MAIVTFWLNAFIPKTVAGYTKVLPAGPYAGKTAIPLPGIARTWPGNAFKDWNAGYLTDQRGFDPSLGASCRMQSIAYIEVNGPSGPELTRQDHRTSGTTEVNLVSGAKTGFAKADMTRCKYYVLPRRVSGVFMAVNVELSAAAGDPLVGMAADIDYSGTVTVTKGSGPGSLNVSFRGNIDEFPAYDCYAMYNDVTKTLFTNSPPAGNTVADLLGGANRAIAASVSFP